MNAVHPIPRRQQVVQKRRTNRDRYSGYPLLGVTRDTECVVWGALALAMRVSRALGVAPLRMARDGRAWRISVSPLLHRYNCVLMVILHASIICGIIMDKFYQPATQKIRIRVGFYAWTWVITAATLILMESYCIIRAPSRMRDMIEYLNIVNSVHINLSYGRRWQPREAGKTAVIYLLIGIIFIIEFIDFLLTTLNAITIGWSYVVTSYLYFGSSFELLQMKLIEIQFVFIGLSIESALKRINYELRQFINLLEAKKPSAQRNPITISDLASSYATTCNALRKMNESLTVVLLILVGLMFRIMVFLIPNFILNLKILPTKLIIKLSFHVAWYCFNLILLAEPGHRVQSQMEHTEMLVRQLAGRMQSDHPQAKDIMVFRKQIALNQLSLSAMGVFNVTRPLILAMCGAITNYIIILMQFNLVST